MNDNSYKSPSLTNYGMGYLLIIFTTKPHNKIPMKKTRLRKYHYKFNSSYLNEKHVHIFYFIFAVTLRYLEWCIFNKMNWTNLVTNSFFQNKEYSIWWEKMCLKRRKTTKTADFVDKYTFLNQYRLAVTKIRESFKHFILYL